MLKEMAEEYRTAAEPLRQRLHELRQMLRTAKDPVEIWHIKRRIAELTPMLTQVNDLAWMLEHYYDRIGADIDDRYGCNGIRRSSAGRKSQAKGIQENHGADSEGGHDGASAQGISGVSCSGPYSDANWRSFRRLHKHCLQDITPCGREDKPDNQVFSDDLINSFFRQKGE